MGLGASEVFRSAACCLGLGAFAERGAAARRRDVVKARQQIHDGRLAGSGRTDERSLLTGVAEDGDAVQDGLARLIAERYVVKVYVTAQRRIGASTIDIVSSPCPRTCPVRTLANGSVFAAACAYQ